MKLFQKWPHPRPLSSKAVEGRQRTTPTCATPNFFKRGLAIIGSWRHETRRNKANFFKTPCSLHQHIAFHHQIITSKLSFSKTHALSHCSPLQLCWRGAGGEVFQKPILLFLAFLFLNSAQAQENFSWKGVQVLVYKKCGKGYVHDNIPYAAQCIIDFGKQQGFRVDTSSNAAVMTPESLKKYTLLVFTSTNNDVFDTDAQRLAFRRYIESGGGFVGIHSVTGTERKWQWFKMLLGGTFSWHAKFQKFTVRVIQPSHPSMQGLPAVWEKEDECYFAKELYPGPTALMAHDITSLDTTNEKEKGLIQQHAGGYATLYPAAWAYDFDGGYTWCTALGHDKRDYSDPLFQQHIFQGIRYIAARVKKQDATKAYAKSWDEAVQYK